jgi:hypothetical protein
MLKAASDRLAFVLGLVRRRPRAVGSVLSVVAVGGVLVWTSGPQPRFATNARGFEAPLFHWRLGWWAALPLAIAAIAKLELSFRQHHQAVRSPRHPPPEHR